MLGLDLNTLLHFDSKSNLQTYGQSWKRRNALPPTPSLSRDVRHASQWRVFLLALNPRFLSTMALSDATSSSKVTDLTSTDASGKVPELIYHGGTLTGGVFDVVDNDVIVVTKDLGRSNPFTLYAIEPLDDSEGKLNQPPFTLHTISATKLPKAFLDRHLFQALPTHLSPQKELHVLISRLSGTGLAPNFFETILQPVLTGAGLSTASYNVVRTENAQSVKQYTQSVLLSTANKGQEQTVIMLTGDGGIVDIINGLLESSTRTRYVSSPSSCIH